MFTLKSITIFLILPTIIGLVFLSSNVFKPETSKTKSSNSTNSITSYSKEFFQLEYSLLNQEINYSISDSISSLQNDFEKDYLFALLKTRKKEYKNSFDELYYHLSTFPKHYQYYDELIFNAKASANFYKIEDFISKSDHKKNEYFDYLKALADYHLNKYTDAIKTLEDKDDFNMLYLLSFAYRGLADYKKSFEALQRCKSKINNKDLNMPKVLISEGSLYLLSGDYKKAEDTYNKALQLAEEFDNRKEKSKALINLAILDDENGKVDLARNKLQLALKISRNIENQDIEATVLSELGVSCTYTNEMVNARNNYEKSLDLYKTLNNKERLSNLSSNIAAVYSQQANYSLALNFYNNGLNYAGENVISRIQNLEGLGDVYSNLSNYSKALNYYAKAKDLAKQIKNVDYETDVDVSIGTLFFNVDRSHKAVQIFLNAKERMGENADIYKKEDVDFKIGIAYSRIDSIEKSNIFLKEALKNSQSVGDIYYEIIISGELAYNYYTEGKFNDAAKILLSLKNKSRDNKLSQLEAVQNLYLGKIKLDQNLISKAISYFENADELALRGKDYNTYLEAEYLLGKCYELSNNQEKAEFYYNTAIEATEKISETMVNNSEIQISHFAGFDAPFNALAELHLKQGKNENAFQIIEKSRSRNTFQNLNDLLINTRIKDNNVIKQYYDLKWQINSGIYSGEKLKSLESELKLVSEKNSITDKKNKNTFDIKSVQSNLDKDENIITYFLADRSLYAFIISKENFKVEKIKISRNEVKKMINHISALYSENVYESDIYFNQDLFSFNAKASNEFYDAILKDVVSSIPENQKIIFSMPMTMALIPMEFLVTKFEEGDSPFYYDNKTFLIEKYAISYTPSIPVFILQKKMAASKYRQVLFVGDPEISNKDFAISYRGGLLEDNPLESRSLVLFPLKYSRQEIEQLSDMFSDRSVFLLKDATEKNFKENAANSSIIHLSTHSFLYKDQPLIIFSKGPDKENEDSYLELEEIHQLKLNSDLVVLSSCRSGIGAVDKAEGILGMQKSFFEAGAKSVVVSMWDVNDKYTSLFMQSFYKYLVDGNDKSEALRKAKVFFMKNYSANPYNWGAFVLSGNISPINISKENHFPLLLIIIFILATGLFFVYYFKIKSSLTQK